MANEKRLIDADAFKMFLEVVRQDYLEADTFSSDFAAQVIETVQDEYLANAPTVDAVEVDEMREFASDVAYQFGYYCQHKGRLHITHGGLSTLEWAFDILGWENPHPVPECECEIDGCHEHATCGAPTADGYKRMCGKHCRERRTDG